MQKFSSLLIEIGNEFQTNCSVLGLSRSTPNSRLDLTTELVYLFSQHTGISFELRHKILKLDRSRSIRNGKRTEKATLNTLNYLVYQSSNYQSLFAPHHSLQIYQHPVVVHKPAWGLPDLPNFLVLAQAQALVGKLQASQALMSHTQILRLGLPSAKLL